MSETELKNRPPASGHRFGPDLTCSECGVTWDEHQKDPNPCEHTDERQDCFEAQPEPLERLVQLPGNEGSGKS